MSLADIGLVALCGVLGFGIIWHMMGSRNED